MDPIALATITSALTLIATEVAKGTASEAGKALWTQIKSMLGLAQEPSSANLAPEIAGRLAVDSKLAKKIVELLQAHPDSDRRASALVEKIDAEKVIVAREFNISGDFRM